MLSHCNEFGVDDFSILAETGGHFVSSPDSEIALGIARPTPFMYALLAGVQPSLGTDCVTCMSTDMLLHAHGLDLLAPPVQLRPWPHLPDGHRAGGQYPGRPALGHARGGEGAWSRRPDREPDAGQAADVVLVDATAINLAPVLDPVADLVLHAHAGNVDTVVDVRKRHGALTGVDLPKLLAELESSREYLMVGAVADAFAQDKDELSHETEEWSQRITSVS